MSGEGRWDPERLGRLTLAQLFCLCSPKPLGAQAAAIEVSSIEDLEAALARIDEEDADWYRG